MSQEKKQYAMSICAEERSPGVEGKYDKCYECALEIFVSQSTWNALPDSITELRPYCMECGVKLLQKNQIPILPATAEQKFEIESAFNFYARQHHEQTN